EAAMAVLDGAVACDLRLERIVELTIVVALDQLGRIVRRQLCFDLRDVPVEVFRARARRRLHRENALEERLESAPPSRLTEEFDRNVKGTAEDAAVVVLVVRVESVSEVVDPNPDRWAPVVDLREPDVDRVSLPPERDEDLVRAFDRARGEVLGF